MARMSHYFASKKATKIRYLICLLLCIIMCLNRKTWGQSGLTMTCLPWCLGCWLAKLMRYYTVGTGDIKHSRFHWGSTWWNHEFELLKLLSLDYSRVMDIFSSGSPLSSPFISLYSIRSHEVRWEAWWTQHIARPFVLLSLATSSLEFQGRLPSTSDFPFLAALQHLTPENK